MDKKCSILVVDDEQANLQLLSSTLDKEYDIFTAINGHEAISQLKKHAPDLILLDVMMPDIDGFEVCKIIKANPSYIDIPIIFLTALETQEDALRGLEVGAIDFLTKPVNVDLLKLRVRNHINLKERNDLVKEQRDLLAQQKELQQLLLDSMTDAVFISNAVGEFIEFNDAFATFHKFKNKAECAKKLTDYPDIIDVFMASGELAPLDMWAVPRALRGETVTNAEYSLRRKDTGETWVGSYSFGPIRDKDGLIVGSVVVGRDITSRKSAERALQESEKLHRDMIENVPALFYNYSTKRGGLFYSPQVEHIFGYPRQEFYDNPQLWKESIHPDDVSTVETAIAKIYENGDQQFDIEYRIHTHDGEWIWLRDSSFHHVLSEDEIVIHGIAQNISNLKQTEEEKVKLQAQLQQAQKMESVGRLAGGVAHDFNNMLTIIHGYTQLSLMDLEPASPLLDYLDEIKKAADRSAGLTRQLLAFARKQSIAPKVLDLNEVVTGTLKMLQRLIGEDIHLLWHPASNLWQVNMDPSQIDQILANLCVNARDAIVNVGKITIETANIALDEEYCATSPGFIAGEYVLLSVSDDGSGMDKVTMGQIFEPFFTTKALGEGTGLGLATVYGIVKQNNGFINVYSEPGQGTSFTIYLPRYKGNSAQASTEISSKPLLRGQETILLVEDEIGILNMTKALLERQGYTLFAASKPGEAIRIAEDRSGEIDLLITDVILPDMNGRDLSNNLLKLCPQIKGLFLSGYTANVIAHHGVLDDGVNFIHKPFSVEDLTNKVREVLDS